MDVDLLWCPFIYINDIYHVTHLKHIMLPVNSISKKLKQKTCHWLSPPSGPASSRDGSRPWLTPGEGEWSKPQGGPQKTLLSEPGIHGPPAGISGRLPGQHPTGSPAGNFGQEATRETSWPPDCAVTTQGSQNPLESWQLPGLDWA